MILYEDHTRRSPMHPQTQGRIERFSETSKNIIFLEHHLSSGELSKALGEFNDFYNNNRLPESLINLASADLNF